MNGITTRFLGEEIIFPEEIVEYVSYLNQFTSMQIRLTRKLYSFAKDWGSLDEGLRAQITYEAKEVVKMLANHQIYNVTVAELLNKNIGYKKYGEEINAGYNELKKIMSKYFEALISGYEVTERNAYSKVRGSGTMLISSNMTSSLVFSAVECGLMSMQAQQAKAEFGRAVSNLVDSNTSAQEREERQFMKNVWFPKLSEALTIYIFELMNTYLQKLEEKGVYNYSAVAIYDAARSNQLLGNLNIVQDKKPVLIEAYKACPYNGKVYEEAQRLGYLDCDMYKAAETFKQQEAVKKKVLDKFDKAQNANDVISRFDANQKLFSLVACIKRQPESEIVKAYFGKYVSEVKTQYSQLGKAACEKREFVKWLKRIAASNVKDLFDLGEEELKSKLSDYVHGIIAVQDYDLLTKVLDSNDLRTIVPEGIATNDITEINNRWIELLETQLRSFMVEASQRKEKYDVALSQYLEAKQKIENELSALESELASLGFFAFSKKKQIVAAIDGKKEELTTLKHTSNVDKLRKSFENME